MPGANQSKGFNGYGIINNGSEKRQIKRDKKSNSKETKTLIFITEWYTELGNRDFLLDEKDYQFSG